MIVSVTLGRPKSHQWETTHMYTVKVCVVHESSVGLSRCTCTNHNQPQTYGGKSLASWSHNVGATYQTCGFVRNFWERKLSWILRMKFCRATPTHRYDWFGIPQEFLCEMLASYWSVKVFSLKRFPLYMIAEHVHTGLIPSCMYCTTRIYRVHQYYMYM